MKSIFIALILGIFLLPITGEARQVSLYDQPNATAKVIDQVDLSVGLIPIFTPKNGGWMKVADPRNGNVGWVKSQDLNTNAGMPETVKLNQSIISNGQGALSSPLLQYQTPQPMTPEQTQAMQQRLIQNQKAAQQLLLQTLQDVNTLVSHPPVFPTPQIPTTQTPVAPNPSMLPAK